MTDEKLQESASAPSPAILQVLEADTIEVLRQQHVCEVSSAMTEFLQGNTIEELKSVLHKITSLDLSKYGKNAVFLQQVLEEAETSETERFSVSNKWAVVSIICSLIQKLCR